MASRRVLARRGESRGKKGIAQARKVSTEEETKLKMPFEMDDDFEVEQKPRKAVH